MENAERAVLANIFVNHASPARQAVQLANLRAANAVYVAGGRGCLSWVAAAALHPGAQAQKVAKLFAKVPTEAFAKLNPGEVGEEEEGEEEEDDGAAAAPNRRTTVEEHLHWMQQQLMTSLLRRLTLVKLQTSAHRS